MLKRRRRMLASFISILSFLLVLGLIAAIVLFSISSRFWYIASIIFSAFYVIQLCFGFHIFFSKRIYEVKSSWLLVLLIPIIGLFTFLMFGTIPFKLLSNDELKDAKKDFMKKHDYEYTMKCIKKGNDKNIQAIYEIQGNPIYEKNDIIFLDRVLFLEKLIEIIRKAKECIYIQYYIIADSAFLRVIINELVKKARKGIKIKLMIDYAGSNNRYPKKLFKELEKEGIETSIFNPPMITKFMSMINFRSHRKSVCVDNKYCVTGGSNIGDEYINLRKKYFNWNDTNFYLEGEIVNSINLNFLYDWYFNSNKRRKSKEKLYDELSSLKIYKSNNNVKISSVDSEPYLEYKMLANTLISYISSAKENINILTPYFALNNSIIDILNYKAMSGVNVNIVLPRRPDNKNFIIDANMSMFQKMSKNIHIFLYDGFIHSKAMIIDDKVFVGTNNFDYRSLIINFETMFIIDDKSTSVKFNSMIENIKSESILIDHLNEYKKSNIFKKVKMKFINIIYPLI